MKADKADYWQALQLAFHFAPISDKKDNRSIKIHEPFHSVKVGEQRSCIAHTTEATEF